MPSKVARNGQQFFGAATFTYNAMWRLSAVRPNHGPAAGGTHLVLAGRNLAGGAAHEPLVRFEDKADADGDGESWQRVQATYGDYRNGDLTCVSPAAAAGATTTAEVGLQASSNSQQWDDASLGYAFYAHPTIERIEPAAGPTDGSTLIRVFGTHLHGGRKGERRCRVGDDGVAVMASFDASHGALLCRTPHVAVAGSEPLQIALNEEGGLGCEESAAGCSAHYATVGPHFSYFDPPQPELATPARGFSNGTEVVVSGVGVWREGALCRFGNALVNASQGGSADELRCVAPTAAAAARARGVSRLFRGVGGGSPLGRG